MRQLKNNARVGLLAKLGRKYDPKLAARVVPAEPRIERALYLRWVRAVFTLWQHKVADRWDLSRQDQRTDAVPRVLLDVDWDTLVDESGLKDVLDKIARSLNGRNSAYFEKILRTNPPPVGDIAKRIADFRKSNIELVKNAGHEMVADLNETLSLANSKGLRHEEIAKTIQARVNVGASRAKAIARDQTLKYNASAQQAQADAAGINEYTWSTSKDGAVRPMHKVLEGKRFKYSDPPVTNEDGDHNNPGEDYNCRCNAIPYIALFEDSGEETSIAPVPETVPMSVPVPEVVANPLQTEVNQQGIGASNYLRSGMRDLTAHRAAYAGADAAEAQQIALGQLPARDSGKFFEPVRVSIETDRGQRKVTLRDGRHRMTAAREAGAKEISAHVTEYGPRGGVLRQFRGAVKI